MIGFSLLIFSLLFAILVINIWQARTFQKRSRTIPNSQIDDSKYYELKYQAQYVTSIFPIIIAILSFVGYNYISSLPEKINSEVLNSVKPQIDSLKNENQRLLKQQDSVSIRYNVLNNLYAILDKTGGGIDKKLSASTNILGDLNKKIYDVEMRTQTLANKDILKQPVGVPVIRTG
jgi:heme/copper-type cytochrome/quinol oxidase subunit 2